MRPVVRRIIAAKGGSEHGWCHDFDIAGVINSCFEDENFPAWNLRQPESECEAR